MNTTKFRGLSLTLLGGLTAGLLNLQPACLAQPNPHWLDHDRRRPLPRVVDPGTASTQEQVGKAPSDAVVLFDGKDLSQWVDMDGHPTKWVIQDGVFQCVPGSGFARTLENFGDCQLHLEWATPTPAHGEGQGRGNSGVFFGFGRYEVQVLDSYHNVTYADGSAGSIYGQYPPLVNCCRPPGEWQSYDILYTAPRFTPEGKLKSPARMTIFQNGLLIQNDVTLTGPTSWLERAPYDAHSVKEPLALQDHGNPVRFRNIWVRELGHAGRKEFTFSNDYLDGLAGRYEVGRRNGVTFTRNGHHLVLDLGGVHFVLFAESRTHFFAKTTDVQCEFRLNDQGQPESVTYSVGEGGTTARRVQ
jgi:3-keto-disaccharide hydrolase